MQTPIFGSRTTARQTTARQTSSCGTVTVTADDDDNGGQDPGNGGNGGIDTRKVLGGLAGVAALISLLQ